MVKVLFISSGKNGGEPGSLVKAQGESLGKTGIQLTYYTFNQKGLRGYLSEISRLSRFLRNNSCDIIHAHYGLTGIIAFFSKKKQKLIVSFMGDDLIGSNRIDGSVTLVSRLLVNLNVKFAYRFYDYSLVKSQEMLEKIQLKKASVLPNGVCMSLFRALCKTEAREKLGIGQTERIALFVSLPTRTEKNYKLAQRAIALTNMPNLKLITVSGIDHSQLIYYYNSADLLLVTSFHEGSPNTVKEAMACNCPIVSTNVGDVEWVIGNTKGCYLSSFDPEDFSQKIKLALRFAEETGKTNGRERLFQLGLDSETIAKRMIEVYNKVLD